MERGEGVEGSLGEVEPLLIYSISLNRAIAFPLAEPDEADHEDGLEPGQPPAFLIHTLALGLRPLHHLRRKITVSQHIFYIQKKSQPKRSPRTT